MDELGKLVSTFVEERVDVPRKGEEDLWSELVCAGLFSVAFHVVIRLPEIRQSPESLQYNIKSMISATTAHASVWVNQRLSDNQTSPHLKIEFNGSTLIRARLIAYFNEALLAMSERGYDIETARSHACFALLSSALEMFIVKGLLTDAEEAADVLRKGINGCDSMAQEIVSVLNKKHTNEEKGIL